MMTFLDCWIRVAADLFSQALAGQPEFEESLPKPMDSGAIAFTAAVAGDLEGRFTVVLDPGILTSPLMGEGVDQKALWEELLREVANAAAGEMLAKAGKKCRVESLAEGAPQSQISRAFQLRAAGRAWKIQVRDELREARPAVEKPAAAVTPSSAPSPAPPAAAPPTDGRAGIDLLLDVELEATLRFGGRELPLGEILDLGPGDVVSLDRHITDPVDLIVGDKIVARGEVVLVNGNFGLRVTEVASPRRRLESIRCLF